ncbi:MAG: hypothetical protein AAFQ96_07695 [Pseudomonadota bacterium]
MTNPLQNRVTPFGEIIAVPSRGALMGNRGGRMHDPQTRRLTNRRWASKQWISCRLNFKGRQRKVMGAGYTELFFLDEATALAAGHRPCFECRRNDAVRFADCWADGAGPRPRAGEMDRVLHRERLDGRLQRRCDAACETLPPGVIIALEDGAYLLGDEAMRRWSPAGYGAPVRRAKGVVSVLTPPSIVRALVAGYAPIIAEPDPA